ELELAVAVGNQRTVISVDPECSRWIHIKSADACLRQRGGLRRIESNKTHAIEPCQAVVSPDPKITVRGLRDGGDRTTRQAVLSRPNINEVLSAASFCGVALPATHD